MPHWWETTIFYQIYPRSFADSNGDGIGDIGGIIEKLDYLQWLGVNGIWLSPHYPSPQIDVGYDVADYTAVNPEYGTMRDFERMLDEMHQRDMRLILDLVLNHTSHQHAWFQASRSSRDDPKRDWYIWRDGVNGEPPNNWQSTFGGSAWTYDEATDQWYYHYFLKEQPDLNWRNPDVKAAMFDAARFWLEMGVDGYRLDAIGTIYEDPHLTPHNSQYTAIDVLRREWIHDEERADEEISRHELYQQLFKHQHDLPEVFDLMRDFRAVVDEYEDRFLVGETSDIRYLGAGTEHLHSIFNFDLTHEPSLQASAIRDIYGEWRAKLPAGTWQCLTLNNHDQSRIATHFGGGDYHREQCQLAAALPLLLAGVPFLYYGEEIGMEDYAIQSFDELRDLVGAVYAEIRREAGVSDAQILDELGKISRDRCRTPMQWNESANAGFSPADAETWLPVHENHAEGINVAAQRENESSLLGTYRRLMALWHANSALQIGTYHDLAPQNDAALIFSRQTGAQTCFVALNFTAETVTAEAAVAGDVLFSTADRDNTLDTASLMLAPFEILIVEMTN